MVNGCLFLQALLMMRQEKGCVKKIRNRCSSTAIAVNTAVVVKCQPSAGLKQVSKGV